MDGLMLTRADIEKVLKSAELTDERAKEEGFEGTDEGLEGLKEFAQLLLRGGDLDGFLISQDMVVPD